MRVGTFIPDQSLPVLHAMAGDDCSLHHDLTKLSSKQEIDHRENQILTCALQVALIGLSKNKDYVALAKQFNLPQWSETLQHYVAMFRKMGLETVPETHYLFEELDFLYERVANSLPPVDLVNLYMISGSNRVLHRDPHAFEVSRNVNSKLHFARHAPQAGIPVPRTEIYKKHEIISGKADDFFSQFPEGLMIKLLGLAGARNVFRGKNVEASKRLIHEYDPNEDVLLQEILNDERWQEMTVDLTIKPNSINISNVRRILLASGKWVGNYLGCDLNVSDSHREVLLRVGEYARDQGYVAEEGVNCGIDYFISGDDILVTEINARWTGGLFPAEFVRMLDTKQPAIAFFDLIQADEVREVQEFQKKYLYHTDRQAFSYVPMGFTPFITPLEEKKCFFVWQLVLGDFALFVEKSGEVLSRDSFPTATAILKEAP